MKRRMEAILTAVPLLVLGSAAASAGEPLQLNGRQMDNVTAAGSAMADAISEAVGLFALTATESFSEVEVLEEVLETANFQATSIQLIGSLSEAKSLADTTGLVNDSAGGGNDSAAGGP